MTTRISTVTETLVPGENRSWLLSDHGANEAVSLTLDSASLAALFPAPTGSNLVIVPSGTIINKITATGKYGPYDSTASDGRQTAANALILKTTVQLSTYAGIGGLVDSPAAGLWHCGVITSKLPCQSGAGAADSSVKSALKLVYFS